VRPVACAEIVKLRSRKKPTLAWRETERPSRSAPTDLFTTRRTCSLPPLSNSIFGPPLLIVILSAFAPGCPANNSQRPSGRNHSRGSLLPNARARKEGHPIGVVLLSDSPFFPFVREKAPCGRGCRHSTFSFFPPSTSHQRYFLDPSPPQRPPALYLFARAVRDLNEISPSCSRPAQLASPLPKISSPSIYVSETSTPAR
jgi:hypothetical protein